MRFGSVMHVAVLLGSPILAAIYRVGSTCTITPQSATAVSDRRRAMAAESAAAVVRDDSGTVASERSQEKPGYVGELYPRPEPGSDAARGYDRRVVANRALAAEEIDPDKAVSVAGGGVFSRDQDRLDQVEASVDDTPQILEAFRQCGQNGHLVFTEGTYNIRQVMNTTDLRNCEIDLLGTFVWSADNIQYWLSHSFSVVYAGRSTAWLLGGTNISMRGHGKALFNGNGQVWIDQNRDASNQNGRPISLTVWHGTNVLIDGITWRMAQFWHTFVAHSQNVTMTNLDMNTFSSSSYKAINTDGTDIWNSRNVVIANWTVKCGDDCVSVKGNSTNVHVSNVVCYESGCACIGSVGSNAGQPDYVDNVWFENITCHHSSNAAWIKTYAGTGHVRNVTFKDIVVDQVDQPIYVTSCIYSNNGCDTSRLTISDVTWKNITGTARYNVAVGIHCSASSPCTGFHFENIDIKASDNSAAKILCSNIQNQADDGLKCTGTCPAGWPQQLKGNR